MATSFFRRTNLSVAFHHLRLTWNLAKRGHGASVYPAVNNVFDRKPGNVRNLASLHVVVGRNSTPGLRHRF